MGPGDVTVLGYGDRGVKLMRLATKFERSVAGSDVAELLARIRIEEANARVPGALIIGAHQVVSLNGKVLEKPTTGDGACEPSPGFQ
jgi:predicted house-cleaning NTP pyrophosphatase (Maf/HAM1 superfamily)